MTDAAAFDPFTPAYVSPETMADQTNANDPNAGAVAGAVYNEPASNANPQVSPYQQAAGKVSAANYDPYAGKSNAQAVDPYAQAGKTPMQAVDPYAQTGKSAAQSYVSPYMTAAVPGMPVPTAVQGASRSMPAPQRGSTAPITMMTQPAAVTLESLQYFNGYLRTQIGRKVTVDFLIGTNTFVDRTGTLLGVGANYLLLREEETDDITVCDFFSVKFVKIYY